jgi:hypothetical protein
LLRQAAHSDRRNGPGDALVIISASNVRLAAADGRRLDLPAKLELLCAPLAARTRTRFRLAPPKPVRL